MNQKIILKPVAISGLGALGHVMAMHNGVLASHVSAMKTIQRQLEPVRQTMAAIQGNIKRVAESIRAIIESLKAPILKVMAWRPLIYVVPPVPEVNPKKRLDRHLAIEVDPYGYFVLGGKTLPRLHSRTSRCGRFLHKLLLSMSEVG